MNDFTIDDAIKKGNYYLSEKFSNYKNETLWILQTVLNIDLSNITLNKHKSIDNKDYELYISLIKRRQNSEPIQHILNSVIFYGYKINVNNNVFIPRPETELIIDIVKKEIGFSDSILEIGTGTGCISICLELEQLAKDILSLDINYHALKLAKENAKNLKCSKIKFKNENFLNFSTKDKFNLIISNPPYISLEEIPKIDYEVTLYDPMNALTDYKDGLAFYRQFNNFGKFHLQKNGYMLFEFGSPKQVNQLKKIFSKDLYNYKFINDLSSKPRFILLNKKND